MTKKTSKVAMGLGAAVMISPPVALSLATGVSQAATPNPCINPHCYSTISYRGAPASVTGIAFQEEDSNMYVQSTAGALYHVNSEGWYAEDYGDYIEEGLTSEYQSGANGWLYPCNCDAYTQFWADTHYTAPGQFTQWVHAIANISPDGAEHTYTIKRAAVANQYDIELDNNVVGVSGNTDEWSGYRTDVGGEFYGPNPGWNGSFANTFDIYHKLYNAAGSPIDWPGISVTQIDEGFNGLLSNNNNTYSWNMPG